MKLYEQIEGAGAEIPLPVPNTVPKGWAKLDENEQLRIECGLPLTVEILGVSVVCQIS